MGGRDEAPNRLGQSLVGAHCVRHPKSQRTPVLVVVSDAALRCG